MFFGELGVSLGYASETTEKIGISDALKGCIKRARYKGREEVNLGTAPPSRSGPRFGKKKKARNGVGY